MYVVTKEYRYSVVVTILIQMVSNIQAIQACKHLTFSQECRAGRVGLAAETSMHIRPSASKVRGCAMRPGVKWRPGGSTFRLMLIEGMVGSAFVAKTKFDHARARNVYS